jgi:hypothetical protein
MPTVFSNSPVAKDWVRKPFEQLARSSSQLWLASPYFTEAAAIVKAARSYTTSDNCHPNISIAGPPPHG